MNNLTIALGLWAAIGPLIGIYLGHFLSRASQREQWKRDQRIQEWRELLTAVTESLRVAQKLYPGRALSGSEEQMIVEAHSTSFRVIRDRIFIATDVHRLDVENRWGTAVERHSQTLDIKNLNAVYTKLRDDIVGAALRSSDD